MRLLVGAVVSALLVSACGGTGIRSVGTDDVGVEVLQYRRDEADQVVEVKVRNDGGSDLRIDRLELVAPGFDGVGPVDAAASVAAGQAVDIRVPYGQAVCDGNEGTSDVDGGPAVLLWFSASEEPLHVVTKDVVLQRIHARDCAVRRVLDVLPMAWSGRWQRQGRGERLVVHGELDLGPVAAGHAVEVTDVRGTTLFTVDLEGLPVALDAGGTGSVPVTFQPARCDPHAVGESKRGYAFGVEVLLDGAAPGDAVLVTMQPDEAARVLLEQALLERCGLAHSADRGRRRGDESLPNP